MATQTDVTPEMNKIRRERQRRGELPCTRQQPKSAAAVLTSADLAFGRALLTGKRAFDSVGFLRL